MKIYNSLTELVGKTPLVRLERYCEGSTPIYAKLEYFNPTSSVKDRAALYMLNDAEQSGSISPGGTIIEPTSGNTGVGLAFISAIRGYRLILTMPESMSLERRQLLSALRAEIVLTPAAEGMDGAVKRAGQLKEEIPGSFIPGQFDNGANARAHYETTGPEIYNALDGAVDYFVACVGSGGTVTGVGRYLKERNPNTKIIAVEPAGSPLLSEGRSGPHGIQGIGANFVPSLLDRGIIDEIVTVSDDEAFESARKLAKTEGMLVGISSGAAACAALHIAKREPGKNVITLFPDTGERYLSAGLYRTTK